MSRILSEEQELRALARRFAREELGLFRAALPRQAGGKEMGLFGGVLVVEKVAVRKGDEFILQVTRQYGPTSPLNS